MLCTKQWADCWNLQDCYLIRSEIYFEILGKIFVMYDTLNEWPSFLIQVRILCGDIQADLCLVKAISLVMISVKKLNLTGTSLGIEGDKKYFSLEKKCTFTVPWMLSCLLSEKHKVRVEKPFILSRNLPSFIHTYLQHTSVKSNTTQSN